MKITLNRGRQAAEFRRSIRDKKGKLLKVLTFAKDVVVELTTEAEREAVRDLVGGALAIANDKDRPDVEATKQFAADVAEAKQKQNDDDDQPNVQILPHQRKALEVVTAEKAGDNGGNEVDGNKGDGSETTDEVDGNKGDGSEATDEVDGNKGDGSEATDEAGEVEGSEAEAEEATDEDDSSVADGNEAGKNKRRRRRNS